MKLKVVLLSILLAFAFILTSLYFASYTTTTEKSSNNNSTQNTPTPTIITQKTFQTYVPPRIEKKREYTIVMIGDSMTHALGPHGGPFYEKINLLYKNSGHGILVDNYANPSTNILSLDKAMNTKTTFNEWTFEPLLSRQFDMILIESFGYNPLSQYGIENGIKKQTEELNKLMTIITNSHPNSAVIFVATIAPNRINYGKFVNAKDPPSARAAQVDERIAYIKNHITYAKEHRIPVINIFEKSLTPQGDGNLKYINPHDYIHPSAEGIDFISQELADYIFANQLFPL